MAGMIVWTDGGMAEAGAERDFSLDLACGIGEDPENDFVLELPDDVLLQPNAAVHVDGTPWGGIVYGRSSDTARRGTLQWTGRTWQGVLQERILYTSEGDGHARVSGTVAECVDSLVSMLGLEWLLAAGECPGSHLEHEFTRHPDGWAALRSMLAAAGLRPELSVSREGGALRVLVGAGEPRVHDALVDSELADFAMDRTLIPYNHVIALGQGEGAERDVVHRYRDADGNVSGVQTLFGCKERALLDDYPNAEHEELVEHAEEKLSAQRIADVEVTLAPDADLELGDVVSAYDQRIGERVESVVSKVVLKVENGSTSVALKVGSSEVPVKPRGGEVRNVVSGDYRDLANKPSVEGVELVGDKTLDELGLDELGNVEIAEIFNNVMGRR